MNKLGPYHQNLLPLFIIILSILFFVGGPNYHSSRHFKALWNIGHIIYFALFPLFIRSHIKKWPERFSSQAILILTITLILGLLIELIQGSFQRTPDIDDLIRNMIGALVGISFLPPGRKAFPPKTIRCLQIFATALVILQFYPIIIAFADEYIARNQFPLLSGFETPFELQRWTGNADFTTDQTIHHSGQCLMKATLKTTRYSGVALKYFPENWDGYTHFQFSIYNPSTQAISLTCRIHDKIHTHGAQEYRDRFNRTYELPQGWNTVSINLADVRNAPADRQMDMHHITGVSIFATALENPRVVYIDDVKIVY